MQKKRNFNLLKPLQPPSTAWDKIYEWLIGKARVVILITELLVATTFVLKVIADTSAKNKDREIDRLNNELSFYSVDLEPTFRKLQLKSDKYVQVWNNSSEYNNVVTEVLSYIQNETSEISINVDKNTLTVLGYEDLNAIKSLEAAVKSSSSFTNSQISDLSLNQNEVQQNKGRYALIATIVDIKRAKITL